MLRSSLAVTGAFVVGLVVMTVTQMANMALFPPPPGFDFNDPDALAKLMAVIPLGALLGVELSYALAGLAAGAVVAAISKWKPMVLASIVGGAFTLAGFANLASLPHPLWFAVLSTATYVPAALAGVWVVGWWRGRGAPTP